MGERDKHHHKHQDPNRPQSTDIADAIDASEEVEAAERASRAQRAAKQKHDISARVVQRWQEGDELLVTIASGSKQGIENGMEGKLVDDNGRVYTTFRVYRVDDLTCRAKLNMHDVSHDDIVHGARRVIINPSKH